MAFSLFENSIFGGSPVELYDFNITGASYSYNTSSQPVVFQGKTYAPITVTRSSLKGGETIDRAGMTVTLQPDVSLGELWIAGSPSEVMTLTIYRVHRGDTDFSVLWKGRALSAGWTPKGLALTCESIHTSMRRAGLRANYQTHCRHAHYGPGCELSENAHKILGQVATINGNVVEVAAAAGSGVGFFSGGKLRWVHPDTGGTVSRAIESDDNNGFLGVYPLPTNLPGGHAVEVLPGCDRTLATCASKFSNDLNQGGMPFIPTKNPFNGSNIW